MPKWHCQVIFRRKICPSADFEFKFNFRAIKSASEQHLNSKNMVALSSTKLVLQILYKPLTHVIYYFSSIKITLQA